MTTLISDPHNQIMLADTQSIAGDVAVLQNVEKVVELNAKDGDYLIGFAGLSSAAHRAMYLISGEKEYNNIHEFIEDLLRSFQPDDFDFLAIKRGDRDNSYWGYSSDGVVCSHFGVRAAGSGMPLSLAALRAGATPEKALDIAINLDVNSGGQAMKYGFLKDFKEDK